jgi:hypothetical protein
VWWSEELRRADIEEHGGRRTSTRGPEDGAGDGARGHGRAATMVCHSSLLPPSISLYCVFFSHYEELPDI